MNASNVSPLTQVLATSHALLLDFDGPICSVFAGLPAPAVANRLRELIRLKTRASTVDGDMNSDPLALYATSMAYGSNVAAEVNHELVRAEREAVTLASPTVGAVETIQAARESGRKVAIVSNNAAQAINDYLNLHRLTGLIDHVAARRTPEPGLMKPNPRYLAEALDAVGVAGEASAIVGDSVTDIEAAWRAGSRSIGYANKPGKADRLASAGAESIIESMSCLPPALTDAVV